MWTLIQDDALPAGIPPCAWLDRVTHAVAESDPRLYTRVRTLLGDREYARDGTFFASDALGPAGLVVSTASGGMTRIELVAVRDDVQRQGLGGVLLDRTIAAASAQGERRLTGDAINSRSTALVGLLESRGFVGQSDGSIRMRRQCADALPPVVVPDGFELRSLHESEHVAWVDMLNASFQPESLNWTLDNFQREFVQDPVFEHERVFVMLYAGALVGTATAWEADFGDGPVGLIHWVGVIPSFRRRGVGIALTVRALESLADRGYSDAWLNTSRHRVATHLYGSLGFEVYREMYSYVLSLDAPTTEGNEG